MSGRLAGPFALSFLAVVTLTAGAPGSFAGNPYSPAELRAVEPTDEAKIRELRDQEITQLRIALGRRQASNRRADLYYRLAEIYVEAYRASFLLEGRAHERRLEKGQEDKFIDRTFSQPFLHKGIQACNDILRLRIPFSKLDQVYYFLGFSYNELGNRKQAAAHFETLVRRYPSSPFASEAYRELGDASFAAGQHPKAQQYYQMAVKSAPAALLPRILHKLAWSQYRMRQVERSVATMKEAIAAASKSGEKYVSLRDEALRDMAVFMTETGKTEEAIAYFQSVAGDKNFYPRLLEKLGKQYERNVEPQKAVQVYQSLLKTNPDSEAAFRVLVKIVDLDLRQGHFRDALGRLKNVSIPDGGESETVVAAQNLRAMVRRTATEHHEKFRKKGERASLEVAEAYYSAYLAHFLTKDDPRRETPEIQMYLAEVKRDLGKPREASGLYREVLGSGDKRYAKEAGVLWTASLSEAIKKTAPSAADGRNREPSELEKEFVDAADRMQEALGETPEAREAALKAAQVLAGYRGTQKDAIERIERILSRWQKSPQALTAARLWIQLLADRGIESSDAVDDLSDAIQEVRKHSGLLSADQEIGGGKLKLLLAEQEMRIKVGGIARLEREKNFAAAAKAYEAVATESPQREFAERAYENATGAYGRVGDGEATDRVTSAWLKRFPKSPKAVDSLKNLASAHLVQGRFDQAARFFERAGKEGGDAASLETAARLFNAIGDGLHAQLDWAAYLELFPKSPQRWKVALALAEAQDAGHRDSEAAKGYQYCMTGPAEFEAICGSKLADLYMRNKDFVQARAVLSKVAAQAGKQKNDGLSPFVAYARFRLAELMENSAKMDPLQLPEAQLKRALNQRLEFLEPLSRAYMAAVDAGGPWAVAALGRLASWAMNFAHEVDAIPVPAGTSTEAAAKFRQNLTSVSGPLRKKAIATWNDAYVKAVAAEALSPALPEIADQLSDARMSVPGRAQGMRGRFRLAGLSADGGNEGRSDAFHRIREKLVKAPLDAAAWTDYGNLLWGEGKPLLAEVAYDRALELNAKSPAALNNRAVVALSVGGQEDWLKVVEAARYFQDALAQDGFFLAAKVNRGLLLNYFRLFAKAKPLWEQVVVKDSGSDAYDGLAVALQGLGEIQQAEVAFGKANEAGGSSSRFARLYHEAARASLQGAAGAEKCLDRVSDIEINGLDGFEKTAVTRLKRTCEQWKSAK